MNEYGEKSEPISKIYIVYLCDSLNIDCSISFHNSNDNRDVALYHINISQSEIITFSNYSQADSYHGIIFNALSL